jgi:hypothetical protein
MRTHMYVEIRAKQMHLVLNFRHFFLEPTKFIWTDESFCFSCGVNLLSVDPYTIYSICIVRSQLKGGFDKEGLNYLKNS